MTTLSNRQIRRVTIYFLRDDRPFRTGAPVKGGFGKITSYNYPPVAATAEDIVEIGDGWLLGAVPYHRTVM